MEMDYVRSNDLTESRAIQIMGQFFPEEWRHLQAKDVRIGRSQTGVNNEVYFVSRNHEAGMDEEPSSVVVRIYGVIEHTTDAGRENKETRMKASEVEQILMLTKLADRGLGPRLLGVFDGGRVEEMIDCNKITIDDAYDEVIEADIARNLARIHGTEVPLKKPGSDFLADLRELDSIVKARISYFEQLQDETLLPVITHDYQADLDFLQPLMDCKHNRIVLINWDTHVDNIALRKVPTESGLKSIIFDFEFGQMNIRGKDLGLFIVSRSGFFPIATADRKLGSAEQSARFLRAYQQEIRSQFEDVDVDGRDSIDHLMLESLVGGMVSCGLFILMIADFCAHRPDARDEKSRQFLLCLPPLFQAFEQCKQAIQDRFPDVSLVYAKD